MGHHQVWRGQVCALGTGAGVNDAPALAIPLSAGALYNYGIVLSPAVGALLMSLSTVIVAVNARFLKLGA